MPCTTKFTKTLPDGKSVQRAKIRMFLQMLLKGYAPERIIR